MRSDAAEEEEWPHSFVTDARLTIICDIDEPFVVDLVSLIRSFCHLHRTTLIQSPEDAKQSTPCCIRQLSFHIASADVSRRCDKGKLWRIFL